MKTFPIYLIAIALLIGSCKKEKNESVKEVPDEVIRTITSPTLYPRIEELFPDKGKTVTQFPYFFSDTVQKKIILTESSEVFLTFIAEKAQYKNTVGWYSYTLGNEPKKVSDINIHILFPNVSAKGEGGELQQGDMLQLGEQAFPKGTVIGFFLIIKGWQNGSIDYSGTTHYTDYYLNQGGFQQHLIFKEKDSGDIVLGFEDMPFETSDRDYNDLLFKISDNKEGFESIYFDINKLPVL